MPLQLKSSDFVIFDVEEDAVKGCELIARYLETLRLEELKYEQDEPPPPSATPMIFLPNIHSIALKRVINWLAHHNVIGSVSPIPADGGGDENVNNLKDLGALDLNSLHELVKAANFLQIDALFQWAILQMADIINESKKVGTALATNLLSLNRNQLDYMSAVKILPCVLAAASPPIFKLFPEIWDFTFPYLAVTDIQSVINSHQKFRGIFKSETVDRLLPLWLPIFLKNCGFSKVSSLLHWRLVNKAAKGTVDNLLEEERSPRNCYNNTSTQVAEWIPTICNAREELRFVVEKTITRFKFSLVSQIQQFMNHVNSTPSSIFFNPFLSKSLFLDLTDDEGAALFRGRHPSNPEIKPTIEPTLSMLSQFGHGISTFRILADDIEAPRLFSFLCHFPNLKVLQIAGEFLPRFDLENVARLAPQVRLNHLELLDISDLGEGFFNRGPTAILGMLLRLCGPRLKRLVCNLELFQSPNIFETLRHQRYPNLRFLLVGAIDMAFVNQLFVRIDPTFPLEEIQINFSDDADGINLMDVLSALRRFADSLVHLTLFEGDMDDDEVIVAGIGNLVPFPNLSKFTTNLENIHSAWFHAIVQLQAHQLTELNLHFDDRVLGLSVSLSQHDVEVLQQILELVPNLEKITIFCGFFYGNYRAERVVIERNGTMKRLELKKLIEKKSR